MVIFVFSAVEIIIMQSCRYAISLNFTWILRRNPTSVIKLHACIWLHVFIHHDIYIYILFPLVLMKSRHGSCWLIRMILYVDAWYLPRFKSKTDNKIYIYHQQNHTTFLDYDIGMYIVSNWVYNDIVLLLMFCYRMDPITYVRFQTTTSLDFKLHSKSFYVFLNNINLIPRFQLNYDTYHQISSTYKYGLYLPWFEVTKILLWEMWKCWKCDRINTKQCPR